MSIKVNPMEKRGGAGFTLLEVLVALFVLAIGLLGAGAMQMIGVQANQGAYWRTQAVFFAYDIADRMRANPSGVADSTVYDNVDTDVAIPADPGCSTAAGGCTAAQIAQLDLFEWGNSLAVVPGAQGLLTRVAGTNNFTVTINWQEREWDQADVSQRTLANQTYSMTFRL